MLQSFNKFCTSLIRRESCNIEIKILGLCNVDTRVKLFLFNICLTSADQQVWLGKVTANCWSYKNIFFNILLSGRSRRCRKYLNILVWVQRAAAFGYNGGPFGPYHKCCKSYLGETFVGNFLSEIFLGKFFCGKMLFKGNVCWNFFFR